jgi:hypothetical protein
VVLNRKRAGPARGAEISLTLAFSTVKMTSRGTDRRKARRWQGYSFVSLISREHVIMARQSSIPGTLLAMFAAMFLALGMVATAGAAESDDPSGDWTWTFSRGDREIEISMTLKVDGEKLSGTVGRDDRKSDIQDGTFKDGTLSFKTVRERNGQSFTVNYEGKLESDAIKGKVEFEFGGETRSRDWEAKRVK